MLRKAVIPAAGLGTRLLSVTKEQPKEMLPVFAKGTNGDLCLKPIVQLVFEQLYQVGFREFCFIVGRGKRAIEDHFTPDFSYVSMLDSKGKDGPAEDLENFYKMIDSSTVSWVNQSEPRGFGDAVLKAKSFAGEDKFMVHAGDSHFLAKDANHLRRVMDASVKMKANALFLSMEVLKPASKLAIMPVYVFDSNIFKALEATKAGFAGELQLTDGIQKMVDWNLNVYTTKVESSEIWLDIGSPDLYWQAQNLSHEHWSHEPG